MNLRLPCPWCGNPMDGQHRCWICGNRLCVICNTQTGSPFLELCLVCDITGREW